MLIQIPRIELAAKLAALAPGNQMPQPIAPQSDQAHTMRKEILDHARQRKRWILKTKPNQLRVLIQERNDLARLGRQSALTGCQQIEVRQHHDAPLHRSANRVAQLRDHGADQTERRHSSRLFVLLGSTIEIEAAQVNCLQTCPKIDKQKRREILITLDQRRQAALQLGGDLGHFRGIRRLDGGFVVQVLREVALADQHFGAPWSLVRSLSSP